MSITANSISKNYGRTKAVDIKELVIYNNCITGLVGNNGAGKTTLIKLILDLIKLDTGKISIFGIDNRSDDWKIFTGAFIDSYSLIDFLTPEEYFYFTGKTYGLLKSEIDTSLEKYYTFFNREILKQKKIIRQFSSGNQYKIGLIGAMLSKPKLLILDEPFNFLDPTSQSLFKNILVDFKRENQSLIFLSSHNLEHTSEVCDRFLLIEKGLIIKDLEKNHDSILEVKKYFEENTSL